MKRRWIIVFVVLVSLGLAAAVFLGGHSAPDHAWFDQFDAYPLVIAHADDTGQGLWPGNTMAFLAGSAELGVDVLEMDVHMSRDGHIVLMHDERVDRTTDGSGLIKNLALEELKALEVGGNWTQDGGVTFPYQDKGLRVPALEEVFTRFPEYPMVIEMKQESPSIAGPFCDLIRRHRMTEKVLVPSFSSTAIDEFRAACPEVATAASGEEARAFVIANYLRLAGLLSPEYHAFQVPEESSGIPVVIPHFVDSAHAGNIQVHIWTINDEDDMKRFISMGVDGIMTDRPDILVGLLNRQ